jgi:hypothetical protein
MSDKPVSLTHRLRVIEAWPDAEFVQQAAAQIASARWSRLNRLNANSRAATYLQKTILHDPADGIPAPRFAWLWFINIL